MRILLTLLVLVFTAHPAVAQEDTENGKTTITSDEIIYRVNLGRADDVKLLLEQGASPDAKDEKGTPILSLAAARTDAEGIKVMNVLHQAGADINGKDTMGKNALFYAAEKGNKEAVQYLLENKINYYSTDSEGNIARTIAHRSGHGEIVTQLDDFVKSETEKVAEQYRELSKALEARYKAQEDAQKAETSAAAQDALERSRKLEAEQELLKQQFTAQQEENAKRREEMIKEREELIRKRNSDEMLQLQYDLAFHACAFQYWSFCRDAGQTSELKQPALDGAIDSHTQRIVDIRKDLEESYATGKKFTAKIISAGQQSVFNQLDAMPSKTYRFQQGVCRMDDLIKRCKEISKYPGYVTTPAAKKAPARKGSGNKNDRRRRR